MVGKVKKDLNNHYQLLENAIKLTCSSFHSITPWHSFINTLQHPLRCIEGKPWTWVNTSNKCPRESHIKPLIKSKLDANMYHVLLTTRWLFVVYVISQQNREDRISIYHTDTKSHRDTYKQLRWDAHNCYTNNHVRAWTKDIERAKFWRLKSSGSEVVVKTFLFCLKSNKFLLWE